MNIILPSETFVREFDAKLLQACHLAALGHQVVVGSRIHIHNQIAAMPRGLYLSKDVRHSSRTMFRILRDLGYTIDALDEEGLLILSAESYRRQRVDAGCLQSVRTFYAWGESHAEIIRTSQGADQARVVVAGNPRIDLLRPEMRGLYTEDVKRIQDKYSDFFLINTNFGRVNPAVKVAATVQNTPVGELAEYFEFRKTVFADMAEAVRHLVSHLPHRRFVIRPHPGENFQFWQDLVEGHSNASVDAAGNVVPWLLAAQALVHNGCTTGIEGLLLGTPVIEYRPSKHRLDMVLPSLASHEVSTISELAEILTTNASLAQATRENHERSAKLSRYISHMDGELSASFTAQYINQQSATTASPQSSRLRYARGLAYAQIRKAIKTHNSRKPNHKNSIVYTRQRFPDISTEEVAARLARVLACQPELPPMDVRGLGQNIFLVSLRA